MTQFLLCAVTLFVGLLLLRWRRHAASPHVRPVVVLLLFVAGWRGALWYANDQGVQRRERIANEVAVLTPEAGFSTSNSCRSCHPSQFDSWRHSYHRAMTQLASPESVLGDFNNVTLDQAGHRYLLERRGDEFWVTVTANDLSRILSSDPSGQSPSHELQILMTTGSHHYQVYWVALKDPSSSHETLINFPFVYMLDDKRWLPREDVFMAPPESGYDHSSWKQVCVRCHTTRGVAERPAVEASTTEFGISCEACHGPGERHVAANRDPLRRYLRHAEGTDATIAQPAKMPAPRSAEVCGQCHAVLIGSDVQHVPGEALEKSNRVVRLGDKQSEEAMAPLLKIAPDHLKNTFWPDGAVRVTGREFNDVSLSKCYQGGELSCLSCHSMHTGDRNDQLRPELTGDQTCLQCHASIGDDIPAHTRHGAESSGSRCYNCHMPYTTFGLLKSVRSHRIDSPSVATTLETGRPNACNLCHVDKSLEWTQTQLEKWQPSPKAEMTEEQRTRSSLVLWLLRGDAHQRALAAAALGRPEAREAAGDDWMAGLLSPLLEDPYTAVRYVAGKSLRGLPGFDGFDYDSSASQSQLSVARTQAVERWTTARPSGARRPRMEVFLKSNGDLDWEAIGEVMRRRDDRHVQLAE